MGERSYITAGYFIFMFVFSFLGVMEFEAPDSIATDLACSETLRLIKIYCFSKIAKPLDCCCGGLPRLPLGSRDFIHVSGQSVA